MKNQQLHTDSLSLLPVSTAERMTVIIAGWTAVLVILALAALEETPVSLFARTSYALKWVLLLMPFAFLPRPSWLHPLVFSSLWAIFFVALPEGPMVIAGLHEHRGLPGFPPQVITGSLDMKFAMDCIAIIAMYGGFFVASGMTVPRLRRHVPRLVNLKLLLITAISLAAFGVLVHAAGGIERLALQRGVIRTERLFYTMGGGHWHVVAGLAGSAVIVAAAVMRRPLRSPVFLLALLVAVSTKFIITGSRGGTLAILVLLFLVLASKSGKLKVGKTLVFIVAVVAVIGVMTEFRRASHRLESVREFRYEAGVSELFSEVFRVFAKYASAGSNDFPLYVLVPDSEPLLLGKSYLSIVAAPVPRILWPDKPPGVGRRATDTFMKTDLTGVPVSPVGEAFWNFYVPGVVVVFFAWGILLHILWRIVSVQQHPGVIALYIITIYYLRPYTDSVYKWLHLFVPAVLTLILFNGFSFSRDRLKTKRLVAPGDSVEVRESS